MKIGEDLIDLDFLSGKRLVNPKKFLKYIMSKTKFEQVLNRFLRQDNFDVYVTGNIPEFAGRGDEIHIMPLVFSEFIQTYGNDQAFQLLPIQQK